MQGQFRDYLNAVPLRTPEPPLMNRLFFTSERKTSSSSPPPPPLFSNKAKTETYVPLFSFSSSFPSIQAAQPGDCTVTKATAPPRKRVILKLPGSPPFRERLRLLAEERKRTSPKRKADFMGEDLSPLRRKVENVTLIEGEEKKNTSSPSFSSSSFKTEQLGTSMCEVPSAKMITGQLLQYPCLLPSLERCAYPGDDDDVPPLVRPVSHNNGPSDDEIASLHNDVRFANVSSAATLARFYYEGVHVPKNIPLAIRLFHFAADAGDSESQTVLGVLYLRGTDICKDVGLSTYWFARASAQFHPKAEFFLAMAHLTGAGAIRQLARAQELLKRSSLKGNTDSQLFLKNNPRLRLSD